MPLSPKAAVAALAPETSEREVYLLTISHPQWTDPIRLSTDPTELLRIDETTGTPMYGTVSRGNAYEYLPIKAILPDSRDETPPECKLVLDNVSRFVAPHLLTVDKDAPRITVDVVLASSPDVVDQQWPDMDLQSTNLDVQSAEAKVGMDTASSEPVPWLRFVPAYFPNIFD